MPAKGSKRATARVWQAAPVPFALDLDGVIWLADDADPRRGGRGARGCGRPASPSCSSPTTRASRWTRSRPSWPATGSRARGDVVTSAMAAARLVEPGERVLVCGGTGGASRPSRVEARRGRRDGHADAVLVGFHRDFDYERLRSPPAAVRDGAAAPRDQRRRHLSDARRADPGRRGDPGGRRNGRGRARRSWPGKPHPPMVDLVRDRLGRARHRWWATGPTPTGASPGRSATGSRWCSAASRTRTQIVEPQPDLVAVDLAALVDQARCRQC